MRGAVIDRKAELAKIFASEEEYQFACEQFITYYQLSDRDVSQDGAMRELGRKINAYGSLKYVHMRDGGSHKKNGRIAQDIKRLGIRAEYLMPDMGHYPYNLYSVHYEDIDKARSIGMTVRRER